MATDASTTRSGKRLRTRDGQNPEPKLAKSEYIDPDGDQLDEGEEWVPGDEDDAEVKEDAAEEVKEEVDAPEKLASSDDDVVHGERDSTAGEKALDNADIADDSEAAPEPVDVKEEKDEMEETDYSEEEEAQDTEGAADKTGKEFPTVKKENRTKEEDEKGIERVQIMGFPVKAIKVDGDLRATEAKKLDPMDPKKVERYFNSKFKDKYGDTLTAMRQLARKFDPEELHKRGYDLYGSFRPQVASGTKGWGQAGTLDLEHLMSLSP